MASGSDKASGPTVFAPYLDAVTNLFHPVASPVVNTYSRFHSWKESMDFVQPGTVEALTKEVSQVHLANWFFEGLRADVTKAMSVQPAFQLLHSFQLGQPNKPSSYSFGTIFANNKTLLQGGVDDGYGVTVRANQTWSSTDTTKVQAQLQNKPGQSMIQLEHDHLGPHYALSLKTLNPGLLDGTGIHFLSLLHSVGPRLSLGFETIFQRPQPSILETSTSLLLKLTSLPNFALSGFSPSGQGVPAAFNPSWIGTLQVQPTGNIQTTYFQKLSDKIDVALDFQTVFQPASMLGPAKREAVATIGAKYDLRAATFRGQVDSSGKVGMMLEQRLGQTFTITLNGEIDHAKNTARVGLGMSLEALAMTQDEMIAQGLLQPAY